MMGGKDAEYKPCPGFPDYEVSEFGDVVRAVDSPNPSYRAGFRLKGTVVAAGYRRYCLTNDSGEEKDVFAHQLVLRAFVGPPPKYEVAHNNGVKLDNHYSNLRWATSKENERDKLAHGTYVRGEKVHSSKLTEQIVRKIRAEYTGEYGEQVQMTRDYGVSSATISHAINGRTWRHVGR